MQSFLDKDSIEFEITRYLIEYAETTGNEFLDLNKMKFTSKTLKYIFGDKIKDEKFKNTVVSSIKEMISLNLIKRNNKAMYLTEKIISKYYNKK